jgi:hypothetical protein
MQVKGGRSLSHINWVCPHALRAFFGMTLGCKKQSSRLSAPESKSLGPSSSQKASLGLAKDRHEDESGAWLISRCASLKGRVEVAGSIHHPSPPRARSDIKHTLFPPERLQKDRHDRHHRHTLKISLVL